MRARCGTSGAAAQYGFALGGGNALRAHGLTDRQTEDVDLFTDREHAFAAAADAVEASLRGRVHRRPAGQDCRPGRVWEENGEGLAEWIVTAPGGEQMLLQMAYFARTHQPVVMGFGPVSDLDDVLGGKVCALASRAAERDYTDVAAALARGYTQARLIASPRRSTPA